MKIVVLGSNSFSGRAFSHAALHAGHSISLMNRPEWDLSKRESHLFILDDVTEEGYDTVVNFAALNMVGESWEHAGDYYRTNVEGVARLADSLRRVGIRKFVQVSTPEVYGTTQRFVNESQPFMPTTPYAISRAAADMHLQALHDQLGFPVCFTRTVNVYGPGQQRYRIIPKTIACIMRGEKLPLHGAGQSTRSFIHIRDVADAILRVCADGNPGHTYHAAHPTQISIRNLVAMVCARMGASLQDVIEDAPDRPGKDTAYQLDDEKIRRELGWSETVSLDDGLNETIEWFRKNPPNGSLEYGHKALAA